MDSKSIRLDDTGKNNHIRVLVDASKDGGVWWFRQNNKYQGKTAADSMRSRGWEVVELPKGKVITPELLKGFDIVIRPTAYFPYAQSEEIAYKIAEAAGVKLLSIGFLDYQTLPEKVLKALKKK